MNHFIRAFLFFAWVAVTASWCGATEEEQPQSTYQLLGSWTSNDPDNPAASLQRVSPSVLETILVSRGPGLRKLRLIKNREPEQVLSVLTVRVTRAQEQFWRVRFDESSQALSCQREDLVEFSYRPDADQRVQRVGLEVRSVHLAGSFNDWNKTATPMIRQLDGRYVAYLKLDDGHHQYKFVINQDTWLNDPHADASLAVPDGHNGTNSGLFLGERGKDFGVPPRGDINLAAVRHRPQTLRYFNVVSPRHVEIELRVLQDDASQVNLLLRDDQERCIPMRRVNQAFEFDYWKASVYLDESPSTIGYLFSLVDQETERRYGADGPQRGEEDPAPFTAPVTVRFPTPDWAKHVVWYQVFPERFRNGSTDNDPPKTLPWVWDWYRLAKKEKPAKVDGFSANWYWRRFGGDLQGLTEKLSYFQSLGVTALYLCPVFEANSNHGYDTIDYRHISQYFGFKGDNEKVIAQETLDPATWQWTPSDKLFLRFIEEAHESGLKVVIDGVFNHMGKGSFALQDVLSNRLDSVYADWFEVNDWGPPVTYRSWDGGGWMPNFRKDHVTGIASASARQYLFDITRRWMDPNGDGDPSDGVDGWRLDVAPDVPSPFWRDWRQHVKSINPDAYIIGEHWGVAQNYLRGDQWDAVMNYEFAKRAIRFFIDRDRKISASEFRRQLEEMLALYPMQVNLVMQNLYDSHDTDRLVNMVMNPDREYDQGNRLQDGHRYNGAKPGQDAYEIVKLMATFQMTFLGAPMVWYGDEVGMFGADDPTNRKPMLWKDREPYDNRQDAVIDDVWRHYQRLVAIRNTYPALRTGLFQAVLADDANDVVVFMRARGAMGSAAISGDTDHRDQPVLVVINNHGKSQLIEVPAPFPDGTQLIDVLNAAPVEFDRVPMRQKGFPGFAGEATVSVICLGENAGPEYRSQDGKVRINLPPRSAAILVRP